MPDVVKEQGSLPIGGRWVSISGRWAVARHRSRLIGGQGRQFNPQELKEEQVDLYAVNPKKLSYGFLG